MNNFKKEASIFKKITKICNNHDLAPAVPSQSLVDKWQLLNQSSYFGFSFLQIIEAQLKRQLSLKQKDQLSFDLLSFF
jgi:hypothetical protein